MTKCLLCEKEAKAGVAMVSCVGGLFPNDDPTFFVLDENVMKEAHVHLVCFLGVMKKGMQA